MTYGEMPMVNCYKYLLKEIIKVSVVCITKKMHLLKLMMGALNI